MITISYNPFRDIFSFETTIYYHKYSSAYICLHLRLFTFPLTPSLSCFSFAPRALQFILTQPPEFVFTFGHKMSSQSHHVSATPDRSNDRDSDRNSLSPTARKRALTQNRVSKKRERDSAITEVAITSVPAKCLPYDTTPNTVAQTIHKDFQSLQQKDCTARPDHWWEVLNTLPQKQRKSFVQHSWTMIQQSHYHLTLTSSDLRAQLDSGLKLPLFIPPQSQLGQEVSNQSPWFKQSLEMLLDKALRHTDASISVQDHSLPTLGMFTVPKKCQDVRSRFRLNVEDRGEAWNCLEIRDCLPGDKGPQPLANGARLLDWQFSDPSNTAMSRLDFVALPGSKQVHKWFLVSEKKSGSTAHVDTGYATWVSCLAGRKTFWIRNPDIVDHRQWKDLDVNDDHELFEEPWGRIDLLPGSIL